MSTHEVGADGDEVPMDSPTVYRRPDGTQVAELEHGTITVRPLPDGTTEVVLSEEAEAHYDVIWEPLEGTGFKMGLIPKEAKGTGS